MKALIRATVVNGCEIVDKNDFNQVEILSFEDFMDSLPTLSTEDEIFSEFTQEQMDALRSEYGIRC